MTIYSKSNPPIGFYVYAYLRENGTPYYIGKGSALRAWNSNHTINLPRCETRIVIIEQCLSEIGALAIERQLIRWYGRKDNSSGILQNKTDGGEGTAGKIVSTITRNQISKKLKGKSTGPRSAAIRKKISDSSIGKSKWTIEQKLEMSIAKKGKQFSKPNEISNKKRSDTLKGTKQPIVSCPHCNLSGGISSMRRYHFDKCKSVNDD
jgi:hypothetical protein